MGMYSPDTPPPRDYGQETRDALQAQIDLAPDLYEAEANPNYGRAAFAQLDLDVLRQVMEGVDGKPGYLELYENTIMPGLARADAASASAQREADITDVENLGARASEAWKNANPQQAALIDALNQQAMSELDAGAALPPALARELEQQVRSSQAARGMGYGMADVGNEALIKGLQAEQLQRRRQQFAQNVIGVNAATQTDPFMAILGRPSVNVGQAAGIMQPYMANQGNMFNPESAYAGALYGNNYNAANNAAIASTNAKAGVIGGVLSMGGMLGGGALAGRGG